MAYDQEFFDAYLERRGGLSIKWDGCNEKFSMDLGSRFGPGGDAQGQ